MPMIGGEMYQSILCVAAHCVSMPLETSAIHPTYLINSTLVRQAR